ncbi:hypothetical protein IMZ38_06580 [Thermosphaera chiliense]|uniref:Uncharacterized protein n=1 Tax=Thermosphaera chiliense TaxID=3402707 RepID=A0A7M1UPU0_9CREN|nr:hypothetical protein [Thermosphaera aggregans]QOR94275.1 hypothetical protein IMZ38_06580 [Thermosphaera aggregans]
MPKEQAQQPTAEKSKEVKIVAKQVFTLSDVEKNPRALRLLYVINNVGSISEKALQYLLYYMKESGADLKYAFTMIGGVPTSRELLNEILSLKYVGLLESLPNRKIVLTGLGKEFLANHLNTLSEEEKNLLNKVLEDVKPKIVPIDAEVDIRLKRQGRK